MRTSNFALIFASFAAFEASAAPTAIRDPTRPLVPMSQYSPPNDLDNDPNYFYPTDYRVLNCWECFEAEGKICIDEGHNSLYHHTGSSDKGNAFCCKPDSTHPYCTTGQKHDHEDKEESITTLCSPSSLSSNGYQSVLTSGRNHQMFAFCPSISHQRCGISSSNSASTDMKLKAGNDKQNVYSNRMRYKKPNILSTTSNYDACYYEVTLDEAVLKDYDPKSLQLTFTNKKNMNVYVYKGNSRTDAKESMISGNQQAEIGQSYSVSIDKGFLIVAYPAEKNNIDTEFGFEFWADAVLKPEESPDNEAAVAVVVVNDSGSGKIVIEKQNEDGDTSRSTIIPGQENDMLFYGLCAAAGLLLIAIIFICIKCRRKGKIEHTNIAGNNTNERSLQLEDMEEEDYKVHNDTNRPSLPKGSVYANDSDKLPQAATFKEVDDEI